MKTSEFEAAVLAALDHPHQRVTGVSRDDVREHSNWSPIGRFGRVAIQGVMLTIREHHDSTAPLETATWFTVSAPKEKAFDPTRGMVMLSTPEDKPSNGGNEPA